MNHGKAIAVLVAYDIYLECCEGKLDPSWEITAPVSFHRFQEKLAKQMLQYSQRIMLTRGMTSSEYQLKSQRRTDRRNKQHRLQAFPPVVQQATAHNNHLHYIISNLLLAWCTYGSCPITWGSRLQCEVALSSTEAEYIVISESMRDVLYIMQLVKDLRDCTGIKIGETPPKVHCRIFEDNSGALEMVRLPKMRPRTRHMCVKLHHF